MDASNRPLEGPWEGKTRIIVGIEIGTNDGGVSFAFLQQGANQSIHRVTRWPGQQSQNSQSRIPTLVWYNKNNKAVSFGAEASTHQAEENARNQGWVLAKQFPLHLYPGHVRAEYNLPFHPLPPGLSLLKIYSDFLCYLIQQTQLYFEDHILDGKQIWATYGPAMDVVITCPNEWGPQEREFLRNAVFNTGFVDKTVTSGQVLLLTEAEAVVYDAYRHTNISSRLQPNKNLVVCNAGNSMVKITKLSVATTQPVLKFKGHSSAYIQEGGTLVDAAAEGYLRNALGNAPLSQDDISQYTSRGLRDFQDNAKRTFRDSTINYTVCIAGAVLNIPLISIQRGRMTLSGVTIQSFFDEPVNKINTALDNLLQATAASLILLGGELGESPFFRETFKNRYEPQGHQVVLSNESMTKAIADGAVIWGMIRRRNCRVLRLSYGFVVSTKFDPQAEEHRGRQTYTSSGGYKKVTGAWSQIAAKGAKFEHDEATRLPFDRISRADLDPFSSDLFAYSGEGAPSFAKDQQGNLLDGFRKICTMTANLSDLSGALQEVDISGKSRQSLTYNLCLRFGGVELGAYIKWREKGATRTTPVTIQSVDAVYLD